MKQTIIVLFTAILMSCTAQEAQETSAKSVAEDIKVEEFKSKMDSMEDEIILDVRTPEEWANGTIPGAVKVDWYGDNFEAEIAKLDKSKPVLVYCAAGGRSARAMKKLSDLGFTQVYNLKGGMGAWNKAKYPV